MAGPVDPCQFLTGKMKEACQQAQKDIPGGPGGTIGGGGGNSVWWRHAVLRVVEVVVGVAMVVVGIKAVMGGSDVAKVVVQTGKKVAG